MGLMTTEENYGEAFTRRLRQAFKESGLTQEGLAVAAGAGTGTVSDWIKKGAVPGGLHLLRLPEALNVSGHWLLTGDPPMRHAEPVKADLALGWIQAFARWATATGESEAEDARLAIEAAEAFLSWARSGGVEGTG